MTIVFVFKNGFKLETKCKDFTTTRNNFGDVVGVNAKGITENKFIHIDFSEVICIYRIVSDEYAQTEEEYEALTIAIRKLEEKDEC